MYCLKCRIKKEGKNHKVEYIKDGKRKAIVCYCETCGTKMYRLMGKYEEFIS
jgi:hypothetical protein